MKMYTIIRQPSGSLQLTCEAEVIVKDQRGRSTGTKIETTIAPADLKLDIGNDSLGTQQLAQFILTHYYGDGPVSGVEAQRKREAFINAFLIHARIPPNGKLEIASNIIDRWASLL